ncbi:MAG: DUF177 domain-containing protein [Halanaerobiales bacterium]|nr:DUF177 domain-containing protein [Halanaerobiales bacterium]
MKIDVYSIKFDVGSVLEIDERVKMDDFTMASRTIELPEPIHLVLQVANSGEEFLVTGKMTVNTALVCSRCLEKFTYSMDIDFFAELSHDEMVNDNQIDLSDSIYEHLLLEIPIKTICNEQCKGLCPQCGQNLNLGECGCDREVIDPRLVKLKDFFKKD